MPRLFDRFGYDLIVILLGGLFVTACAPLRPIPEPPVFHDTVRKDVTWFPAPVTKQAAQVAVRWGEEHVEARLTDPLLCEGIAWERLIGTQTTRYELSRNEEIAMWGGYAGAGLTAGLVAIGMARGRGVGRGFAILGLYAIPLGAAGGVQTWRARPITEELPPRMEERKLEVAPCPSDTQLHVKVFPAEATRSADSVQLAGPDGYEPSTDADYGLDSDWAYNLGLYPDGVSIALGAEWSKAELTIPYEDAEAGRMEIPLLAVEDWVAAVFPEEMPKSATRPVESEISSALDVETDEGDTGDAEEGAEAEEGERKDEEADVSAAGEVKSDEVPSKTDARESDEKPEEGLMEGEEPEDDGQAPTGDAEPSPTDVTEGD